MIAVNEIFTRSESPILPGLKEWSMEETEYLNTDDAKTFLGVSRPTLFRLIKEYSIQTYALTGKTNYFKRTDLQRVKNIRSSFRPKNTEPKTS